MADPRLCAVQQCLHDCVARAEVDPNFAWHHGWLGNLIVRVLPHSCRGLCYQWQDEVYSAIRPVVTRIGWHAARVEINPDALTEHHAVIVYDPAFVDGNQNLLELPPDTVYVLDPWHRGRPDLFELHDWLRAFARPGERPLIE